MFSFLGQAFVELPKNKKEQADPYLCIGLIGFLYFGLSLVFFLIVKFSYCFDVGNFFWWIGFIEWFCIVNQ